MLLVVAMASGASCAAADPEAIDFTASPRTLFVTNESHVGEAYTLGSMAVPDEVPRPVTITAVDVLRTQGIEILGVAAFEPGEEGWDSSPAGHSPGTTRSSAIRWVDADGVAGARTWDLAAVTCAPRACEDLPDDDRDRCCASSG